MPPRLRGRKADTDSPLRTGDDITNPPTRRKRRAATEKAASTTTKSSSTIKDASPKESPREEAPSEEATSEEPAIKASAPKRVQTKRATAKVASSRAASSGVKKKVAPREKAAPIRRTTRARARKGSEAPTTEDESNDENDHVRENDVSRRQGLAESNAATSEVDEMIDEKRDDDPTPRESPDVYEQEPELNQVPEVISPLPVKQTLHTPSADSSGLVSASPKTNFVFDGTVQGRTSPPVDERSPDGHSHSRLSVVSLDSKATNDRLLVTDDQPGFVLEEEAVPEVAPVCNDLFPMIGQSWTTTEESRVFSDNNDNPSRNSFFADSGSMTSHEDHQHDEQALKPANDQDDLMDLDVESERSRTPELDSHQPTSNDRQISSAVVENMSTIEQLAGAARDHPILIDDSPFSATNSQSIVLLDDGDNDDGNDTMIDAKQDPPIFHQQLVNKDESLPSTPENAAFTSMAGCVRSDGNKENEAPVVIACDKLPVPIDLVPFTTECANRQDPVSISAASTIRQDEPDDSCTGTSNRERTGRMNQYQDPRPASGYAITYVSVDTPVGKRTSHSKLRRRPAFGAVGVTLDPKSAGSTFTSDDTTFSPLGEAVTDTDSKFMQIEPHHTRSGQDKLKRSGREILPSLSAFLDDFALSYSDARHVQIQMRPYPSRSPHAWHDKDVVVDVDLLHKVADKITTQSTSYLDHANTDKSGSKRKRPTRQAEAGADEIPDKQSDEETIIVQPRKPRSRGAYFNEKGNICIDPPDEDYYEPEEANTEQQEQDHDQMLEEEMADENVVREEDTQQIAIPAEVTPSKEAEPTAGRSSWSARFSFGIGGLFKSPIKLFGSRKSISDFSSPQAGPDKATSSQESARLDNVARPLFPAATTKSNVKSPRKKTPKAKRQAAIDHNEMLQRREAATEAILLSANRAEEIEAEIQRRVQEELALKQAKKSPAVKKRKRVPDGPGSTPHPKKVEDRRSREEVFDVVGPMASSLQTPSRSGYGFYDDVSDEDDAAPPNKRMKTVSFQPSTQSLTTPPQGSDIERIQSRRPPNTTWNYGSMFRDGPSRSALKNTGYIASHGYQSPRYEPMWEDVDPETFEHDAPHNIREGIPDSEFNFAGSFRMPETSDSDEGEEDEEDDQYDPGQRDSMGNTDGAGSTPVRKKTTDVTNLEPETPPAAPQPAHATLPGNKPEVDALQAARTRAHQFTPKQPSRLRETKNVTPPPETVDGILQARAYIKNLDPVVAAELNKIVLAADQENVYPVILAEAGKTGTVSSGKKARTTLESLTSLNNTVLQEVEGSFDGFWSNVGNEIVTNIKSSSESWRSPPI